MERAFEQSGVFEVVKALNGDKAPALTAFLWPSFKLARRFSKKIS